MNGKITVAVAESATAGLVMARFGSITGASKHFKGGMVAYTTPLKIEHLGVDPDHARIMKSVSPKTALEMAAGVTKLFDSRIGVATTGFAEPTNLYKHPFIYYALHDRETGQRQVGSIWNRVGLSRVEFQQAVAKEVHQLAVEFSQLA